MTALQPPLALSNQHGIATVHAQGAHVASWTPSRQDPVLFVSRRSNFQVGQAIRGGVPICWPWFGPGRSGERTPAHGFARTTEWTPVSHSEAEARYRLTDVDLTHEARASFPHEFTCEYVVRAGATLELSLATTNTGETPFEIEEALHTYLAVGDIRQVTVQGLDGATYVDKVAGGQEVVQSGDVTFAGETDRVYRSGGPVVVVDPVLGRKVHITTTGAADTVVWNPWIDKAQAMADFAGEEWTQMLCIEGANALSDFVTVGPGETHEITYRIDVESL